jgi:hypothetical protein
VQASTDHLQAQPWREASARFHGDTAWLGADSAYSIELDDLHVLWLFADTFLDPARDGSRTNGPNQFIRNSVVLQTGADTQAAHDLSQSSLSFHWGPDDDGAPSSFFHDRDGSEHWVWPLHGVRMASGELLLFRMLVAHDSGGFGFRVEAWDAVAVDDPSAPPEAWQPRQVANERRSFDKLVGSSVLLHDGQLYAYAVENSGSNHDIFLARWPLTRLQGLQPGALDDPEWWTGDRFVAQSALPQGATPVAVFKDGQVELSVHFDAAHQRFLEVQMAGLFASDPNTQIVWRDAQHPEGPWSAPTAFYRPSESERGDAANLAAYAAKAHPEQRGAELVLSYLVNDVKQFPPVDALYYPQLLRGDYGSAKSKR